MGLFKTGLAVLLLWVAPQAEMETVTGEVIVVLSGDTFTLKTPPPEEKLYKVRLSNVDAPELKQPFGRESRQFVENLVMNKSVRVNYRLVDTYGRLIGEAILPEGEILNQELLRAGLAWHYRVTRNPSPVLANLEYTAWSKKLGLWVQDHPLPPWEFRRGKEAPPPPAEPEHMDYDNIINYGIIGNRKSRIYLWPECSNYPADREGWVLFGNKLDAEKLGYRASKDCARD